MWIFLCRLSLKPHSLQIVTHHLLKLILKFDWFTRNHSSARPPGPWFQRPRKGEKPIQHFGHIRWWLHWSRGVRQIGETSHAKILDEPIGIGVPWFAEPLWILGILTWICNFGSCWGTSQWNMMLSMHGKFNQVAKPRTMVMERILLWIYEVYAWPCMSSYIPSLSEIIHFNVYVWPIVAFWLICYPCGCVSSATLLLLEFICCSVTYCTQKMCSAMPGSDTYMQKSECISAQSQTLLLCQAEYNLWTGLRPHEGGHSVELVTSFSAAQICWKQNWAKSAFFSRA